MIRTTEISPKSNSTEQRHYNEEEECLPYGHTKIKFLARAVEQQSETTNNTSFDENKI
jgi:hypothetical protein